MKEIAKLCEKLKWDYRQYGHSLKCFFKREIDWSLENGQAEILN